MENILNVKRLVSLINKQISENISKISVIVVVMFSVSIFGWLFTMLTSSISVISPDTRLNMIYVLTTVTMFILPYSIFSHLNHRIHGIDSTMLPASVFEKYLSMVLVSVVIVPLSVFVVCTAADFLISLISPGIYSGNLFDNNATILHSSRLGWEKISKILIITGIALFGNLYFKKNKILRTFMTIAALNIVLIIIGIILVKNGIDLSNFFGIYKISNNNNFIMSIGDDDFRVLNNAAKTIRLILGIGLPVLLYYGTYYKLKHLKF